MHKKRPKICTGCRVSAAKICLYHSTKIAKASPHSACIVANRQFCPEAVVRGLYDQQNVWFYFKNKVHVLIANS